MLSHMLRAATPKGGANFITYTAQGGSPTNASTYTFSSVDIGSTNLTREVFVVISWSSSDVNARSLSSTTIGGFSATIASQSGNNLGGSACIFRSLTTGNTANIVLNFTGTVTRVAFTVYNVINRTSPGSTVTDTVHASAFSYSSPITVTTLTVPANGFALAQMSTTVDIDGSLAITPFTRNNYNTVNASESVWYMSSSYNNITSSSQTPTITTTWTGGTIGSRFAFYAFP